MAEAVLGVIKMAGKPITTAEILTNFGDPPSTIRAIIYRLRDRGLIQADKVGSAVAWTITTRIDTAIAAVQKHSTRAQRKRTESL
jgi:predicted transcriptional regulator